MRTLPVQSPDVRPGSIVPPGGLAAYLGISAAYIVAYLLLAAWSGQFWRITQTSPWYPQAGLTLGLLVIFGVRYWPAVLLVNGISKVWFYPLPLGWNVAPIVIVTTGCGVAGAVLLRRWGRLDLGLTRMRDLLALLGAAVLIPIAVALGTAPFFAAARETSVAALAPRLLEWWAGEAIGILAVTPAVLLGFHLRRARAGTDTTPAEPRPGVPEIIAQVALVALTVWFVAISEQSLGVHLIHLLYLPLLWIVVRHGVAGAALGSLLTTIALMLAVQLVRPMQYSATDLQVFMLAITIPSLMTGITVSDRRRARVSLARSERTKSALINALPDLTLRIRRDGTYLDHHTPAGFATLAPPERFLGKTVSEIMPPDIAEQSLRVIRDALGSGRTVPFEYSIDSPPPTRHFEVRVAPAASDEVVALVRDITDRKKLEADLIRAQKLEAVGLLAAGVAHDFNTLLASIFAYVSHARTTLAPNDPASAPLDGVEAAARQAGAMLRSLLTFSRKTPGEYRPVDLAASVRSAADLIRPTLPRSVTLLVHTPEDLGRAVPIMVLGDDTQLQQVALNLAINARDAMPDGGILRINLRAEPADGADPAHATLEVSDNGVGIHAADLSRIFEPFFSTKASQAEASGLGLAVADHIVKAHGGAIEVHSQPGHGARFVVRLPIVLGLGESEAGTDRASGGRTALVLIVDANRQRREFVASVLGKAGHTSVQAQCEPSMREQFLRNQDIDVVMLDHPSNGPPPSYCLGLLRQARPGIPVILLLDVEDPEVRDQPNTRVILKPFPLAELPRAVAGILAEATPAGTRPPAYPEVLA